MVQASSRPINSLPPGSRVGDFEVVKQLGEGGQYGIPFLVKAQDGNERVLKVFKENTSVTRGMAKDEHEKGSYFESQYVMKVYDVQYDV